MRGRLAGLALIAVLSALTILSTGHESSGLAGQNWRMVAWSLSKAACPGPTSIDQNGIAVSRGDKTGPYVGFNVSVESCPGSEITGTSDTAGHGANGDSTPTPGEADTTDQISIGPGECKWKIVQHTFSALPRHQYRLNVYRFGIIRSKRYETIAPAIFFFLRFCHKGGRISI